MLTIVNVEDPSEPSVFDQQVLNDISSIVHIFIINDKL